MRKVSFRGVAKDVESFSKQTEVTSSEAELLKERLGEVRNLVLDSVKNRWIKRGRRNSAASLLSLNSSKRYREDDMLAEKSSRQRVVSPL